MIFISYFELNPDFEPSELAEIGQNLMSKKLFPAPGIEQLAWYLTPGYWGIAISKAEKAEDIANNINMWRIAKPGIFKSIKIEPALETKELIPIMLKLARKIKD